ncbi:hypothetical protein V1512DRAFT_259932 [Lipomyces arxii]|uniref:uncharacterized protein n=1 Tax=Lipomyces arxii TaxID=56418 RepID=UPI0034CD4E68
MKIYASAIPYYGALVAYASLAAAAAEEGQADWAHKDKKPVEKSTAHEHKPTTKSHWSEPSVVKTSTIVVPSTTIIHMPSSKAHEHSKVVPTTTKAHEHSKEVPTTTKAHSTVHSKEVSTTIKTHVTEHSKEVKPTTVWNVTTSIPVVTPPAPPPPVTNSTLTSVKTKTKHVPPTTWAPVPTPTITPNETGASPPKVKPTPIEFLGGASENHIVSLYATISLASVLALFLAMF